MKSVGAFEAKTHLSELLDAVEEGEGITITRYGKPVARLFPADKTNETTTGETISALRDFREGRRLEDGSISNLIEEGRS